MLLFVIILFLQPGFPSASPGILSHVLVAGRLLACLAPQGSVPCGHSARTDPSRLTAVTVTYRAPFSRKTDGSHGNLHYSRCTTKYTSILLEMTRSEAMRAGEKSVLGDYECPDCLRLETGSLKRDHVASTIENALN
jgi:hypothetical protein